MHIWYILLALSLDFATCYSKWAILILVTFLKRMCKIQTKTRQVNSPAFPVRKCHWWIIEITIPSNATSVPMATGQKQKMDLLVLLFLGTKDAIVSDVELAKETAENYPNIKIKIMESGHLIAIEHAEIVNSTVAAFLDID